MKITSPPQEVHITIETRGWTLTQMMDKEAPYAVYPEQGSPMASWNIGPIEVARILERLGIRVRITVERTV